MDRNGEKNARRCCVWQKGTSQDEVMLNSEKIKPVAIANINV